MRTSPPLSPELEALLSPHRMVVPVDASVESRAIARAAAAWTPPVAARLVGRPPWVFAVAAGVVLALGAGAYAARGLIGPSSSPTTEQPGARPRVSVPPAPVVVATAPENEAPAPVAPRARRAVSKTKVASARPTNAELQLLRAARQDATRGDFAGALVVLAEHARRFRNGGLVEEREALRVKSLAGLGRHEEAQRAAAQFHARFPHSVFLPTFERLKEADR